MTSQLTEQPTGAPIDLNAGCPSNTENRGPRVCSVAFGNRRRVRNGYTEARYIMSGLCFMSAAKIWVK
jgi:hypothetical protein